jgi:hypothetical protein
VIRQAISCDICGSEKKQTNHWFVAYDQGGELRVSGWDSRNRLRPGSKHLCGQTCLHKLVDDFMAKALAVRPQASVEEAEVEERKPSTYARNTDTSLTSDAAHEDFESSARVIESSARVIESSARVIPTPAPAVSPRPLLHMPVELVPQPARPRAEELAASLDEPPRFATRNRRAEAWERERERTVHPPQEIAARRLSNSK